MSSGPRRFEQLVRDSVVARTLLAMADRGERVVSSNEYDLPVLLAPGTERSPTLRPNDACMADMRGLIQSSKLSRPYDLTTVWGGLPEADVLGNMQKDGSDARVVGVAASDTALVAVGHAGSSDSPGPVIVWATA